MNNIEDMQKAFEGQKFKVFSPFKCDISKNEDGNYVDDTTIFAFAWFCRGIASQAQQPTDLSKQLREYAADSGYSHNDYADTMLAAASEIERCAARFVPSQAPQTEIQWISVEERLPEEMRAEICRLRRHVSLVRQIMDMADYNGLSDEDRYTMLAYFALKESAKLRDLSLHICSMTAHPIFHINT